MDAERRHELKEKKTDLELFMRVTLPELMRKHGNRLLTFVTILLAAVVVWTFYQRSVRQERETVQLIVARSWDLVGALKQATSLPAVDAAGYEQNRKVFSDINTFVTEVLDANVSDAVKASAILARAEANLVMGTLPVIEPPPAGPEDTATPADSAATPTPAPAVVATPPASRESYLEAAKSDFESVLKLKDAGLTSKTSALFGLVAVAENLRQFDQARNWLERIIAEPDIWEVHKEAARQRIEMIDRFAVPFIFGPPQPRMVVQDLPPAAPPAPESNPAPQPEPEATPTPVPDAATQPTP